MSSSLSKIPTARRQRAAASAGLAAAVFVPVGVLPWVGEAPAMLRFFSTVVLLAALLLALIAWGMARSIRLDADEVAAEVAVDTAAADVLAESGAFDCGHEHDPDEMHTVCPGENSRECTHTCESCLLKAR